AFQSLISGQVDAMVYPQTVMRDIVNDYDLNDKIRVISPPLIEVKRGIAVSKKSPQLKDDLEIALQAFITSTQYNEIYRKWFVHQKPFWNAEKVFWSMTVLMVLVVGIFLAFRHRELVSLNSSLQQQIDLATEQLSQSNEYLRDLTVTDALTGISNRRAFENSLQEFMTRAHRYDNKFSMLIFDIDNFKRLNDQYGHDMGDSVLRELVNRVSNIVRDVDVLSRWGGEEFTILMVQTSKEGALKMAERCRKVVADTLFDEVGSVTISLGVTGFQQDDNDRKFFKRADDALYQAKSEGKNRVVWNGEKR
ncbi:MAG: GGDEF domain-containing protein, partial [Gammaproteobacteria bacterium]|nr:GGDEF domain-containing protein [Gammaproteobacteria bacterium]